jgi:hypothetical protein
MKKLPGFLLTRSLLLLPVLWMEFPLCMRVKMKTKHTRRYVGLVFNVVLSFTMHLMLVSQLWICIFWWDALTITVIFTVWLFRYCLWWRHNLNLFLSWFQLSRNSLVATLLESTPLRSPMVCTWNRFVNSQNLSCNNSIQDKKTPFFCHISLFLYHSSARLNFFRLFGTSRLDFWKNETIWTGFLVQSKPPRFWGQWSWYRRYPIRDMKMVRLNFGARDGIW